MGSENSLETLSMQRAAGLSATLHLVGPFAFALITLIVLFIASWLMHFNFWDLFRHKTAPADLEFTLIQDTQATRPEKPLFKGAFNQRAGGKQNRKQPLKPSDTPTNARAAQATAAQKSATTEAQPKPLTSATPPPDKLVKQPPEKPLTPTIPTPSAAEQTPPKQASAKPQNPSNEAKSSIDGAQAKLISLGDAFAGVGEPNIAMSNPQDGNAATPGVDVIQDADFGPFMAELEKRIKHNWTPPRGSESRKVQLLFYVDRQGTLLKVETQKSSGDLEADRAAIASVEASAPFIAFPPQVKEDVLPVEFTFDYNVLNPKNAKQALKW